MTNATQSPAKAANTIRIPAEAGIAFVLLVVLAGGALASPNFLTFSNIFVLLLNGAPLTEPIVGHGPFVMNSDAEIQQAIDDFNNGRFGTFGR